jgi:tetratricopeptide (TPR) repeat protein
MIKRVLATSIFLLTAWVVIAQGTSANRALIKGRYLVSEKMYLSAVTTIESQNPTGNDQIWSDLAMGQALAGQGLFAESNKWLLKVSGSCTAKACYQLAKNFIALNDYSSAILYLGKHLADKNHFQEKVIRQDSDFSKLEDNREWIHLWQTDWYSVTEQQAAEGAYLLMKGQVDDARAVAEQLVSGTPNDPRGWFLLAGINLLLKETKLSAQSLDRAWQLAKDLPALRDEMLKFAIESGNYPKVNDMASELLREDPTNPDYLIARSLVRILDGKESLAIKEISDAEESGIAPGELYYQAGKKISASNPLKAELYLTNAINSGVLDARYFFARGIVFAALEKSEQALDDLTMSLDINPYQPELYLVRAQLRLNNGDTEGACHDWNKALGMGNAKAADLLYKYCKLP